MSDDSSATPSSSVPPLACPDVNSNPLDDFIARISNWQRALAVVVAAFTALANAKLLIEQQWAFVLAMLLITAFGLALYVVSHRGVVASSRHARVFRIAATVSLCSVPLISAVAFMLATSLPRWTERGPIFAIARFQGPPLPAPYQDCRPSDMLADTLSDVGKKYSNVTAFELPYVIDPNGRSAQWWAVWHGFLEGADTVVYGEYSLVDDEDGDKQPNRILISPQINDVPILSLGPKTAPLLGWEFPDRIVRIDQLCTGTAQRFLSDGRRLSLALSGLQSFASQEYVAAEQSLAQAEDAKEKDSSDRLFSSVPKDDDSTCDEDPPGKSECSGVLAFYLGALNQRLGHITKAVREYAFSAAQLNRPAPFVNLAELYVSTNRRRQALDALSRAEAADPTSVVAAATRAQYQSEFGDTDEANVEFDRAVALREAQNVHLPFKLGLSHPDAGYEDVALCRAAYYVRGPKFALDCRRAIPQSGYAGSIDAQLEYGRWLIATADVPNVEEGLAILRRLAIAAPRQVEANYTYAKALADMRSPDSQVIRTYYIRALDAQAYTDEELTDQANSEAALELIDRADIHKRNRYFLSALSLYHSAIVVNQSCAYAYSNRSELQLRHGEFGAALRDLQRASEIHPYERDLAERLAALSNTVKHT